jgi:hypothetical protein
MKKIPFTENSCEKMPASSFCLRTDAPLRCAAAVAMLAALAGCANMNTLPAGTPLSAIEQKYGAPTYTCTRPDGQQRAVWSQMPSGEYAWGADIGADERAGPVVSVLTDEHFLRLAQGTWTPDAVRCEYGPPYRINMAGIGEKREITWGYRYMQSTRHSVMWIYMGRDGAQVTHFNPAPDERYQRSE